MIRLAVRRPVSVVMCVICVLLIGVVTLRDIPVDLYPEMENPVATVTAKYDNITPQDMQTLVTEPLEKQIATVKGVDTITSTTDSGTSRIRVTFANSVDYDESVNELQQLMSKAVRQLPSGIDVPTVSQSDTNATPIITLGLVGKDTSSLQQIATDLTVNFESIDGVAGVSVDGGNSSELEVTVNTTLLKQYGLTTDDVVNAIKQKNSAQTVGSVPKGDEEIQLRVDGEYKSIEEVGNTAINLADGQSITVNDVAELKETTSDSEVITKINNEQGVVFSISKQSGSNTVEIVDSVYDTIDEIQPELDEGVSLIVVDDQSTFIRNAISGVVMSLIIGGTFAVLVLLFFLRSVRATTVIGLAIPFAIVSTFILVQFSGQTFNIITLSGLALGIGMMVDSSIVILENIMKYKQEGLSSKQAAIKGGSELVSAVIASTTTTLVVFLPLILIDSGQISDLFLPLALVISFSLAATLVVSVTLVPMVASKILKEGKNLKWFKEPKWMQVSIAIYDKLLRMSLQKRLIVAPLIIIVTVVSAFFITKLEVDTFPRSEESKITISARFNDGTELEKVEDYEAQLQEILSNYDDVIELQQTTIQSSSISSTLQIVGEGERDQELSEISTSLQEDLKQIVGANFTIGRSRRGAGGTGSDVQMTVTGPEQEVLNTLVEQLELMLSRNTSIENVEVPSVSGKPQYTIQVDDVLAAKYGLTQNQVMEQLNTVFNGIDVTKVTEDGKDYNVVVKVPESDSDSISDLQNFILKSANGNSIALSNVATLEETLGPVSIQREDLRQTYTVTADVSDNTNQTQINQWVNQLIEQIPIPEGYEIEMGGTRQQFDESSGDLILSVALAVFLVYTVMAIQFESYLYPFIVMFSLPTTIIGVVGGLWITRLPLSFPVFIGMIMLAGIVVNNAIVLVDYINQLWKRGMDRDAAILEAGRTRLRPILMTTITTVLGMVPIAIGIGEGSETQQPIGVVMVFGLSTSMFFTLIFVPVMYTLIDDLNERLKKLFYRKKVKVESLETYSE
ncbi:efflux RND transporter permease subunit [Bacillus solimangrovi]|nr:efflux RND transporter permease subunit [Bacillus solimangrovi]